MERKVLAMLSIAIAVMSAVAMAGAVSATVIGNAGAVYTIDNAATNHVLYYARAADGSITYIGSYLTNGAGTGTAFHSQGAVALAEDGSFLLVVNTGSNEISVFSVQSSGLTYLSKASSQGTMPISLTVHENWVYVLNAGSPANIAGFKLSFFGVLTYIAGSNQPLSTPNPSPEQIGFSPNGKVLVVTEKGTNMIDTYLVDKHGVASAPITQASAGAGPFGFAFTEKNRRSLLVISEAASNSLSSYAVSNGGNLRTISGARSTGGIGNTPCWVAIGGTGSFAYAGNGGTGTVSAFSISRRGQLTLIDSVAATVNAPALDLAFSERSQFLYVLSANGGQTITGFQVNEDGSLSQVTSVSSVNLVAAAGLAAS